MHSSFEGENFTLPTSVGQQHLSVSDAMLAPLVQDFIPSLSALSALDSSPIPDLTSTIITSLSNVSVGGLGPVPPPPPPSSLHSLPPYSLERRLSRNSYSPSTSDSGIILDVAGASSNSSSQSLLSLIKMGALGLNGQG